MGNSVLIIFASVGQRSKTAAPAAFQRVCGGSTLRKAATPRQAPAFPCRTRETRVLTVH